MAPRTRLDATVRGKGVFKKSVREMVTLGHFVSDGAHPLRFRIVAGAGQLLCLDSYCSSVGPLYEMHCCSTQCGAVHFKNVGPVHSINLDSYNSSIPRTEQQMAFR